LNKRVAASQRFAVNACQQCNQNQEENFHSSVCHCEQCNTYMV
jgi:ribosomal protein L37AE/L43A